MFSKKNHPQEETENLELFSFNNLFKKLQNHSKNLRKIMNIKSDFKWADLVVLNEKNEDYDPDQQQIYGYATEVLMLNLPHDQKYLYLAKEALKAALPLDWQACTTPDDRIVFRNKTTLFVQQEHPLDQIYRWKVIQLKNAQTKSRQLSSQFLDKIDEESQMNQSSQFLKNSSQKKNQKEFSRQFQPEDMPNITEESQSQSFPMARRLSDFSSREQEEKKSDQAIHLQKIKDIKKKIINFVPDTTLLLNQLVKNPQLAQESSIDSRTIQQYKDLRQLKIQIQRKKKKLGVLRQQKNLRLKILRQFENRSS